MGLGGFGLLLGLGQGLQGASNAFQDYTAQKKLAQQLALQQAQMEHMRKQDELGNKRADQAEHRADEMLKWQKEREFGNDVEKALINQADDLTPATSYSPDMIADIRKNHGANVVPANNDLPAHGLVGFGALGGDVNTGKSAPTTSAPAPEMVKRTITPGERASVRAMEQKMTALEQAKAIAEMKGDLGYYNADVRDRHWQGTIDAMDRRATAAQAERDRREEATTKKARTNQVRFAFSQAQNAWKSYLNGTYAKDPENFITDPYTGTKVGLKPPPPELQQQIQREAFEQALTGNGMTPFDDEALATAVRLGFQAPEPGIAPSEPPLNVSPLEREVINKSPATLSRQGIGAPKPPTAPMPPQRPPVMPAQGVTDPSSARVTQPPAKAPVGPKQATMAELRMVMPGVPDEMLVAQAQKEGIQITDSLTPPTPSLPKLPDATTAYRPPQRMYPR